MPQPWPHGGPWMLATTSAAVDWQLPTAALAAASTVRAAALVLGTAQQPDRLLLDGLATYLQARDGAADPLSLDEAAALVRTLAQTHGLVLVVGVPGLLVPIGRAGWTLADLAAAVHAPVAVVIGQGTDAVNHATLAVGALAGRDLTAALITVDADEAAPPATAPGAGETGEDDRLPLEPAGRIPADAAVPPEDFPAAARSWLHPMLHACAGRPKAAAPPAPSPPAAPRRTTDGRRVALLLTGAFLTMSLAVCGLAFCHRSTPTEQTVQFYTSLEARPHGTMRAIPVPVPTASRADPCPQHRPPGRPTTPDAATTERVNAAWKRIEDWLAAHAPAARRSLRPPASARAIADAQDRMSVSFPAELVASLRRHDGVTGGGFALPLLFQPLPVQAIARDWATTCSVLGNGPAELGDDWWHRSFVPFAAAGDGGCLFVDTRPGGHGRVGEFYPEDGVDFARWPASVTGLLEQTAQSLETSRPYDGRYRPKVTADGSLDWEVI